MNTITPIPIFIDNSPARCPECGKDEDIKTVCAHCGYEYSDESLSAIEVILVIGIILFGIWLLCTIFYWLVEANDSSLWGVLKSQWNFIWSLKIW